MDRLKNTCRLCIWFSYAIWIVILFVDIVCFEKNVLTVWDIVLSMIATTIICILVTSHFRTSIRLCSAILLSCLFYVQFTNVITNMKYHCDYIGNLMGDFVLLYFLYGLSYMYSLYQQWLVLTTNSDMCLWKSIMILAVMILLCSLLLIQVIINPFIVSLTNFFLYYIPLIHYILIARELVFIQIHRNSQS